MYVSEAELAVIDSLPGRPVVVDGGACEGEFTAAVLERRPGARVIAVEPQPEGRADGAELHYVALGSSPGVRKFRRAHDRLTVLAGFYANPHPEVSMDYWFDVQVLTLDSLCADVPHIDLIKLDLEGAEYEALCGATKTLGRTDRVMFEHFTNGYTSMPISSFAQLLEDFWLEQIDEATWVGVR